MAHCLILVRTGELANGEMEYHFESTTSFLRLSAPS
jgi:hypothetical protein